MGNLLICWELPRVAASKVTSKVMALIVHRPIHLTGEQQINMSLVHKVLKSLIIPRAFSDGRDANVLMVTIALMVETTGTMVPFLGYKLREESHTIFAGES